MRSMLGVSQGYSIQLCPTSTSASVYSLLLYVYLNLVVIDAQTIVIGTTAIEDWVCVVAACNPCINVLLLATAYCEGNA